MNRRNGIAPVALAAAVIIGGTGAGVLGKRTEPTLRSTIAFVSTRHDSTVDPAVDPQRALLAAEIYLMNGDGTNPRRLAFHRYRRTGARSCSTATGGGPRGSPSTGLTCSS